MTRSTSGGPRANGLDSGPLRSLARCMDTVGEGTGSGTLVQLYDCNNAASQELDATEQRNAAEYQFRPLPTTDPGGSTTNGTQLDIETCTGATDQQFFVEYAYQPVGAPNGKCLDVAGPNNGGDGAVIDIWDCQRESPDQYWLHNANGSSPQRSVAAWTIRAAQRHPARRFSCMTATAMSRRSGYRRRMAHS